MNNHLRKYFLLISILILSLLASSGAFILFSKNQKSQQDIRSNAARIVSFADISKSYLQSVSGGLLPPVSQILEVSLSYKKGANPEISVKNITKKNGYPPRPDRKVQSYLCEQLDSSGNVLDSYPFAVPNILQPPPQSKSDSTKPVVMDSVSFAVTLPWKNNASSIRIKKGNTVMFSTKLTNMKIVNNTPNFNTVTSFNILNKPPQAKTMFPQINNATNTDNYVDITFISSKFNSPQDFDVYHQDINKYMAHMLKYEPLTMRASQVIFHYIDNTEDLGCGRWWPTVPRLVQCDYDKVMSAVNNTGTPWDLIVVVYKDTDYGGSGSYSGVATVSDEYVSNGGSSSEVAMHESGHSLFKLMDEYGYGDGYPTSYTPGVNCYNAPPPNPDWKNSVAKSDYYLQCEDEKWYRPSQTSLMRELNALYFNTVSLGIANQTFNYLAGTFTPVNNPPSTTLDQPTSNSIVSGYIVINPKVSDADYLHHIELRIDNTLVQTIYKSHFLTSVPGFVLDTSAYSPGAHTITVASFDGYNRTGNAQTIIVSMNVTPTPTPPPVTAAVSISVVNPSAEYNAVFAVRKAGTNLATAIVCQTVNVSKSYIAGHCPNLIQGQSYIFSVIGVNKIGIGVPVTNSLDSSPYTIPLSGAATYIFPNPLIFPRPTNSSVFNAIPKMDEPVRQEVPVPRNFNE